MRLASVWISGVALLAGCGGGATSAPDPVPARRPAPIRPAPASKPILQPAPAPSPLPVFDPYPKRLATRWTFDDMALGGLGGVAPGDRADKALGDGAWLNVADAAPERPPWVVRGRWEIAEADRDGMSGRVLRQTEASPDPVASFVVPPWPAQGAAPARYRVAVSVAADDAPRGAEAPLLAWFHDVSHYAEVVAKPRSIEVWTADGAVPDHGEGWARAWYRAIATAPGRVRRLEATVDTRAGRMALAVDDETLGEVSLPLITAAASHTVALRATGGPITYDDLEVEELE